MQKRIELTQSASSLIGNISRVMEYYNSRYRENPIQAIIVTGNGAKLAGIHELINNELGIPARTPNELLGVAFNRQIEVNANILQYVGCFGAVYSPVNFIPEEIKNKTATKDSIMSIALVFAASIVLCVVLSVFSVIRLSAAEDEYETAHAKAVALQPIEDRYKELEKTRQQIKTYKRIEFAVDTYNNELKDILEYVKEICPDSFRIDSINTNDEGGTINCTSQDRLSSVAALVIRLNLCTDIKNVNITSAITKAEDDVTKKRQYTYTITFDYVTHEESMDTVEAEYLLDDAGSQTKEVQ